MRLKMYKNAKELSLYSFVCVIKAFLLDFSATSDADVDMIVLTVDSWRVCGGSWWTQTDPRVDLL